MSLALISSEAHPPECDPRPRHFALIPRETLARWISAESTVRLQHIEGDGHFWVTMEGHAKDHVLSPGKVLRFSGPGLLVVEALDSPASLRIT